MNVIRTRPHGYAWSARFGGPSRRFRRQRVGVHAFVSGAHRRSRRRSRGLPRARRRRERRIRFGRGWTVRPRAVKLAVVVQRYGLAINGGAELHARYIAERLARRADVEILTTCAVDYVTWRTELPAGVDQVNGITVRRFRVKHERDPIAFGRQSTHVFEEAHSLAEELDWLDAEGPASPALIE